MISKFMALVSVIRAIIDFIRFLREWKRSQEIAQAAERNQHREAAIEEAKKAQTPEDAFNAQERIVNSKPR